MESKQYTQLVPDAEVASLMAHIDLQACIGKTVVTSVSSDPDSGAIMFRGYRSDGVSYQQITGLVTERPSRLARGLARLRGRTPMALIDISERTV